MRSSLSDRRLPRRTQVLSCTRISVLHSLIHPTNLRICGDFQFLRLVTLLETCLPIDSRTRHAPRFDKEPQPELKFNQMNASNFIGLACLRQCQRPLLPLVAHRLYQRFRLQLGMADEPSSSHLLMFSF